MVTNIGLLLILLSHHAVSSFSPGLLIGNHYFRRTAGGPKRNLKISTFYPLNSDTFTSTNDNQSKRQRLIKRLEDLLLIQSQDLHGEHSYNQTDEWNSVISSLENDFAMEDKTYNNDNDDPSRFNIVLGYYNVSHVQSAKASDNPVGGKWTRKRTKRTSDPKRNHRKTLRQQLLQPHRTLQHILPANTTGLMKVTNSNSSYNLKNVVAEAINVISFDAFWKLIRLTVVLRGDAVSFTREERQKIKIDGLGEFRDSQQARRPSLSNLTVRAFFDPPRIILGKSGKLFNFQIGPSTSVVLDTSYVDDQYRIGVGGSSGTRFLFTKCLHNDVDARAFLGLIQQRPVQRSTLLATLGIICGLGARAVWNRSTRWLGGSVLIVGLLSATAISVSTGGVEDDPDTKKNGSNL